MRISRITLAALFLGAALCGKVAAQSTGTGGVIIGLNSTSVDIRDRYLGFENDIRGENLLGYSVGMFGQFWSGPVLFRPELHYQFNAGVVEMWGEPNDFRMHKLEMPLMVGLNLVGPLCIEAGPTWGYILSATEYYNDTRVELAKMGMGYKVGAGLQFSQMFVNMHFQGAAYYGGDGSGRTTFYEPFKVSLGVGVKLNKS
jgi:hypothetical protein